MDPLVGRVRAGKASVVTILVALVLTAVVIGGALFFEEIRGWFILEGWNPNAPRQLVRDFVRESHAENPEGIVRTLDANFTMDRDANGKITRVRWTNQEGQQSAPPDEMVPGGELKEVDAVVRKRGDQLFYSVVAQFADGKWGVFRVDKGKEGLRITAIPPVYDNQRPQDLEMY
jgi:hypothetical protein